MWKLANLPSRRGIFISTPSAMRGVFRRLRESARETLFQPLLKGGQVDPIAARRLGASLRASSEGVADEILSLVEAKVGPHTRVEPRHRQSLERFLAEGRELVETFLSTLPSPQAPHE